MVNTAYSNGKANQYFEKNDINRKCVPTGVKHATPVQQKYVIGANDEPNGHGTVYVNWPELMQLLEGKEESPAGKKIDCFPENQQYLRWRCNR